MMMSPATAQMTRGSLAAQCSLKMEGRKFPARAIFEWTLPCARRVRTCLVCHDGLGVVVKEGVLVVALAGLLHRFFNRAARSKTWAGRVLEGNSQATDRVYGKGAEERRVPAIAFKNVTIPSAICSPYWRLTRGSTRARQILSERLSVRGRFKRQPHIKLCAIRTRAEVDFSVMPFDDDPVADNQAESRA